MGITAATLNHLHRPNCTGFPLNSPRYRTKYLLPDAASATDSGYCKITAATQFALLSSSHSVEMITFQDQDAAYTSLKDLISPTASTCTPNTPSSLTSSRDSFRETLINLKDPLLQHAAWAYLQPAMTPPHHRAPGVLHNLKQHWRGVFACFNEVLLLLLNTTAWFSPAKDDIRRRDPYDDDEEEEKAKAAAAGACLCCRGMDFEGEEDDKILT